MTQLAPRLRRVSLLAVLALLWSVPVHADVPTSCTYLNKIHDVIARRTAGHKTYLPVHGGSPVSGANPPDPLVDHVPDFFLSGFNNHLDPRFEVAIAGAECAFGTDCVRPSLAACAAGTGIGTTEEINDNPFGWQPKTTNYYYLGDVGGSIDVIGGRLGKLVGRGCTKIEQYVTPDCRSFGQGDPARWISNVKFFYGQQGGDPNTNDLTFEKYDRSGGDCAHGECSWNGTSANDIDTLIAIALGDRPVSDCVAGANDTDCGEAATAEIGQAAAAEGCGTVSIVEIQGSVNTVRNGPGDAVPLPPVPPIPDPCGGCFNPAKNQYDCDYCQPTCGGPECPFCQFNCPGSPCAACISADTNDYACGNCPCGDDSCTFCETRCVTPTPTPPPTPTPTPTAACTFVMQYGRQDTSGATSTDPLTLYDCQRATFLVHVQQPFAPTAVWITQSFLDRIWMPPSTHSGSFYRLPYFSGGGLGNDGWFTATITAYDNGGPEHTENPLCSKQFSARVLGPYPANWPDDYPGDLRLCGLGSNPTPGVVWPRPPTATLSPTPTPTPSCQFYISRSSGTDCTAVTVTGTILSPPDAVTNADHLTLEQDNQLPIDTASGTFSRVAYFAGNEAGDFGVRLNISDANGNPMCPEVPYTLHTDGPDSWTQCGYDSGGPGLVRDRPPTPAPRYTYDLPLRYGYTGAPFDAVVKVWPPAADSRVTSINIAQPNGPFIGGPLTLARDPQEPGRWVAHLCYDGDDCQGVGYTLTFNILSSAGPVSHDEQIGFAGCSTWACDWHCSDQCICQRCEEQVYCIENQRHE